jgi:hypothetical protein
MHGTHATITHMTNHIGETTLIPQITLSPSPTNLDFFIKLNKCQFAIQLAFAMTINKAQGQTVKHISIDLQKPVVSHRQLYVAFLHATSPEHITVFLPHDTLESNTPNVIYPEVLLK